MKAVTLALLALSSAATARADVTVDPESAIRAVWIHGPIKRTDAAEFRRVVLDRRADIAWVLLDSPGGDSDAAMEIGRLLRELRLPVSAPSQASERMSRLFGDSTEPHHSYLWRSPKPMPPTVKTWGDILSFKRFEYDDEEPVNVNHVRVWLEVRADSCAGACALVWLGGFERSGDVVATLRPRLAPESASGLSVEQTEVALVRLLDRVAAYMREMGAPEQVVRRTRDGSPDIATPLTPDEHSSLSGYYSDGVLEWLHVKCGDEMEAWNTSLEAVERRTNCTRAALEQARAEAKKQSTP